MEDQTNHSLVQSITSAIQSNANPLKITFKTNNKVIFEVEVENLMHHMLQDQICKVVHLAVREAAAAVLVQNKV